MGEAERSLNADELLLSYLRSSSEAEAEPILAELISEHATPLIHEIVRYKLRASIDKQTARGADAEEVCSSVLLKVLERLREWRLNPERKPSSGFMDYIAVTTYHACNQYWRDSNPIRNRIKNRLLYLLTSRDEFAIWKKENNWICGFSSWKNRSDLADDQTLDRVNAQGVRTEGKLEQLRTTLHELNAPVRLNDLVRLIMQIEGINPRESQTEEVDNLPDRPQVKSIDEELHHREFLRKLWNEVQQLSERQRKALLLSLRDENGGAILQLFPALEIATLKQLAATLCLNVEEFAEIWKELPLDDLRIGSLLGITRQQVINLRKCARERLSRRLGFK